MKPIMQIEIEINENIDKVHIFKIEQSTLVDKDARVICDKFCSELFVTKNLKKKEITINKRNLLFFHEEILICNKFSVYIFVFCVVKFELNRLRNFLL